MAEVTDSISTTVIEPTPPRDAAHQNEAPRKEASDASSPQQSSQSSKQSTTELTTQGGNSEKAENIRNRENTPVSDSIAQDSAVHDTSYVFVIDPPTKLQQSSRNPETDSTSGMSWVIGALILLFVIVAVRFRNNSKYLSTLLRGAVEVRERSNVFDDTVRETSFMIVLNVLWNICAGILLFSLADGDPSSPHAAVAMMKCALLAVGYTLFLVTCYAVVGNVFSDRLHTRMWLRGYLAATGLTTLAFFPCALVAICYPLSAGIALNIAIIAFFIGKILFISKGFRIFFTQIDSWLLFLYYLCSLEIVPLVFLYLAARWAVNFI